MLTVCTRKVVLLAPLLLMAGLISTKAVTAEEESGTAIPAESGLTGSSLAYKAESQIQNPNPHGKILRKVGVVEGKMLHKIFETVAKGRPCVDCHAFEFMQRALQDLKKTAYNLDSRTETLLFKVEKRTLCDCLAANTLN